MKKCYNCCNYYKMGGFGGYISSNCHIYGSLDVDQHERHPSTAAETCEMYNKKEEKELEIKERYKNDSWDRQMGKVNK